MTFSTSEECGLFAGMKTVSANTRPSEEMIDTFRISAYAAVYTIVGTSTDTALFHGRAAEMWLTRIEIWNLQRGTLLPMIYPDPMAMALMLAFDVLGVDTYEPKKNLLQSDS